MAAVRATSLCPDKEAESKKMMLNCRTCLVMTGLCCFLGQDKNGGDGTLRKGFELPWWFEVCPTEENDSIFSVAIVKHLRLGGL